MNKETIKKILTVVKYICTLLLGALGGNYLNNV